MIAYGFLGSYFMWREDLALALVLASPSKLCLSWNLMYLAANVDAMNWV